jgi:hypothetical protein
MWLNLKGIGGKSDSDLILRTIILWSEIPPSPTDEFTKSIDDKNSSEEENISNLLETISFPVRKLHQVGTNFTSLISTR